jgi:hypothetical protein
LPYPLQVRALSDGLLITFNQQVTTPLESLAASFQLEGWNYRWSSNYGSPKLDLDQGDEGTTRLEVASATLSDDGKQVRLVIPDMKPAMQMHLNWGLEFDEIGPAESFVHFTVHKLATVSGEGL